MNWIKKSDQSPEPGDRIVFLRFGASMQSGGSMLSRHLSGVDVGDFDMDVGDFDMEVATCVERPNGLLLWTSEYNIPFDRIDYWVLIEDLPC